MFRKEIKGILKNPAYFIIMILPLFLTFIMSEGTKNYLSQFTKTTEVLNSTKEIVLYNALILESKLQFAVSELNFMLMMYAILAGLSIFEERRLHIWDRVVNKVSFIFTKFIVHYIFAIIIIAFNMLGFWILFNIKFPIKSTCMFLCMPIISIVLGLFIGIIVKNRAILSNTILMMVMMMGFFGGALSLTSVLANTKYANVLMYLSPLTMANKLIFKDLINLNWGNDFLIWIAFISIFLGACISMIGRRIRNGSII